MVKITFRYARRPNIVVWADDNRWLDSAANLLEGALLKSGCIGVHAHHHASETLWSTPNIVKVNS